MKYCIGVDLGGTNIATGLVDLDSKRILDKMSVKTNAPRPCEAIVDDIVKSCVQICEKNRIKLSDLVWIGIATPGIVKNGVVISAPNLGWKNAELSRLAAEKTNRPVFTANDANSAAYAEALWGSGAEESSLVALTLGTGVGGGIIVDGKIWEGINGFAAELGHMVVEVGGRQCGCGQRGCLEAYCSATALVNETKRVMKLYPDSLMWQKAGGSYDGVNGMTAFRAAEEGDYAAKTVINSFTDYLAIGVANVVNMFQPAVVCIGGGISGEGDNLIIPLREKINRISFGTDTSRFRLEVAKYRNDAGIIGAALLGLMREHSKMKSKIEKIVEKFDAKGYFVSAEPYGNGHINDTRLVRMKESEGVFREYILQRINKNVFREPEKLMENYVNVTEFLRNKIIANGGDPERETVNVIKTRKGINFAIDEHGDYWRLIKFVTDSLCFDRVEKPEQFYHSAVAFGHFQNLLSDYPADTLHETIVNFHNTPERLRQLDKAVSDNLAGRVDEVKAELEFVNERREFAETLERAHKDGKLPLKVTHNDTKLNNILFDKDTGESLCVIDLDTIMPGYSVNDFGDSIRFGATTAAEDEADLSLVNFDINLYELYVKGFLEGAAGGLTPCEIELLPIGAMMMTFECGTRFLADYLNGDTYFRTHRPGQNLDRARNQFKLVRDMEERLDEMRAIVKRYI